MAGKKAKKAIKTWDKLSKEFSYPGGGLKEAGRRVKKAVRSRGKKR